MYTGTPTLERRPTAAHRSQPNPAYREDYSQNPPRQEAASSVALAASPVTEETPLSAKEELCCDCATD